MAETASKQSLNSVTPEQDPTSEIIESSPSASPVDTSPYQASIPIESETNNVSQTKPTGTDNSTIENNEATSPKPSNVVESEPTGTDNSTIENNEATSLEPSSVVESEPTGTDNSTIENNEATSPKPSNVVESEPTGTDNSTIENNEATSPKPSSVVESEPTGTDNSTIENNEATSLEPSSVVESEPTGTDNSTIENNEATSPKPSNVVEPEQHATSDSKTIESSVTENPLIIRDSTISPQNWDAIESETQIEFPIKSTEPTTADLHQSIEEKEASAADPPVLSSTTADPPVLSSTAADPPVLSSTPADPPVLSSTPADPSVVTDTKTSSPDFASPHSRTPPNTPSAEPAGNTYTFDNSQRTQKGYQKATPMTTENIPSTNQKRKRHGSAIASSSTPGRSNKFQILYSAIPILICAAIALVISILEIIFGTRYHNQCSANPNIPTHLYLAGIITIFTTALSIVTSVALSVIPLKEIKNSKELTIMVKILRIILVVTHVLLILFLFSLFRDALTILKTIQYDRMEESKTFCNKKLHRFTGIICIVHIIDAVILCCFVFRIRNKQ